MTNTTKHYVLIDWNDRYHHFDAPSDRAAKIIARRELGRIGGGTYRPSPNDDRLRPVQGWNQNQPTGRREPACAALYEVAR